MRWLHPLHNTRLHTGMVAAAAEEVIPCVLVCTTSSAFPHGSTLLYFPCRAGSGRPHRICQPFVTEIPFIKLFATDGLIMSLAFFWSSHIASVHFFVGSSFREEG